MVKIQVWFSGFLVFLLAGWLVVWLSGWLVGRLAGWRGVD
jgi:hypothetical protein